MRRPVETELDWHGSQSANMT